MALISQWDLDGDATDSVGTNDGSLVGSPTFGDSLVTYEPDGQAVDLSGSGQYINVPSDASLEVSGAYSLVAWAERADDTDDGYIIGKGDDDYYLYMYSGDGLEVGHKDSGGTYRSLTTVTPLGTGHKPLLVGVYDGVELRLYINGIKIATTAQTNDVRTTATALRIGSYGDGASNFWIGRIDKVRVYDHALSDADVLTLYRNESKVIFEDDFSVGTTLWETEQEVGSTAAIAIASPPITMDGGDALKCSLGTGDERAELLMSANLHRFTEGDDIYYRFLTYLEDPWPVDALAWGSLVWQTHNQGSVASPVVAQYIGGDPGEWSIEGDSEADFGATVDWDGPVIATEQVDEWVIRVNHSSDPAIGLVEVWRNKTKVASNQRKTLPNDYNYFKTGYYRDTDISGTGVLWIDGYTVTRENLWLPESTTTRMAMII